MSGETRELNNRCDEVNNVPESVNQPDILDASTFSSITSGGKVFRVKRYTIIAIRNGTPTDTAVAAAKNP